MVGHGGSSASPYLVDPTSPIPSHCASIVATSTLRVNTEIIISCNFYVHHQYSPGTLVCLTRVPFPVSWEPDYSRAEQASVGSQWPVADRCSTIRTDHCQTSRTPW